MSAAPSKPLFDVQPANPLAQPAFPIDPATLPTFEQALDQDLRNLGLFRMQERAKRLRGVTDPVRARGIEQATDLLGDDYLLQRYGEAARMARNAARLPQTTQAARVATDIERQEQVDAENPVQAFAADMFAGVAKTVQDIGVSAYEAGAAVVDILPQHMLAKRLFGVDLAGSLRDIASNYRERVMTGEQELDPFLQDLNVRAGRRGSWGVATGEMVAQALPSLGVALRGTQAARRAAAGLMWVFGTWSAGQGIEKYRREAIDRGEQPNAATAFLVGVGYAAAEVSVENLDRVIPWQQVSTGTAQRIGEAILGGKPRNAARYVLNSGGYALVEGLENVVTGEMQSFVDMAGGGTGERTPTERLREFAMGAAGSGVVTAAGSMLPSFRAAIMAEQESPTELRGRGIDIKMAEDARAWLASDPGRKAGIAAALSREVAAARTRDPALKIAQVDVEAALAEMQESLRLVGVERTVEAIPEAERSPGMSRSIQAWRKRGIEVVPIRPDPESPIAASPALSQPGVVLVEMTGRDKVDEIAVEVGLIAHEAMHQMRQVAPEAYGRFMETVAGPVMAAARQYVNASQAQGLSAHADALLSDPDLLVEEGGALLFQQMIEHAGLTSTLAGHGLGARREIVDFAKRTMTRLGLRGPAATATLEALQALRPPQAIRPVQPPADVLVGVPRPRFATKRPVVDRAMIATFAADMQTTLRDMDADFDAVRRAVAMFAERTIDVAAGQRVMKLRSMSALRKEVGRLAGRKMVRQADEADANAAKEVRDALSDQLRVLRKAEMLEEARLSMARKSVSAMIRSQAPVKAQANLIEWTAKARTADQFGRVLDSLAASVAKESARKQAVKDAKALEKAKSQVTKDAAAQKRQLRAAEVEAAASAMRSEMEKADPGDRLSRAQRAVSDAVFGPATETGRTLRRAIRNFFTYGHMKPETAALFMFGDGTGMRVLYDDLATAASRRLGVYIGDTQHLMAALDAQGFKRGSQELAATSAVLSQAYGLAFDRPGDMFHVKPIEHEITLDGGTVALTSAERITLLGLLRHPQTRSLLMDGTPVMMPRTRTTLTLTGNDIAAIEGTAPLWERNIVDAMAERYDGPMAGALADWATEKGHSVEPEPSYWPRKREAEAKIEVADWSQENMVRMNLLQSKTQDRKKPIIVGDAFADYLSHSWRIAGLTNLEQPVAFARETLTAIKDKAEELGNADGMRYFAEMLDRLTLEAMGHPGLVQETFVGPVMVRLRNNLVRGLLGANPRVILLQFGGLVSAASRIEASYLTAALPAMAQGKTIDAEIHALSPDLSHRIDSNGIGLVSESAAGSQSLLGFRGPGWFVMRGISALDHMVVRTVWAASKMKVARQMPNATKDEQAVAAARMAEKVVIDTQPSFDVMHQSGTAREASRSAGAAIVTMFTSQMNAHLNLIVKDAIRARRGGPGGAAQLARSLGYTVVGNSLLVMAVNAAIDAAISGVGGDEGDERTAMRQFADQLQQNSLNMIYGGNIASSAVSRVLGRRLPPGSGASPLLDTTASGLGGPVSIASGLVRRLVADTAKERRESWDQMVSGLDDAIQGLVPLGGVPIAPYRLGKRALGASGRKRKSKGRRAVGS